MNLCRGAGVPMGPWSVRTDRPPSVFFVFFLALVCSFPALAAAQLLPPEESSNVIRGTVINMVTGAPIARALVRSNDDRYAMMTDDEGHFEFTLPKAKDAQPVADSAQFFSGPVPPVRFGRPGSDVFLSAHKPGFLDDPQGYENGPASPGVDVTLSLMPEAVIKGQISLSTGDAAAGIQVQLFSRQVQDGAFHWWPMQTIQANSDGEFRFAELLPGTYKIGTHEYMDNDPADIVSGGLLFGYPPVYYPSATNLGVAGPIQVTGGQTVEADLSLTRQSYYAVSIPVANVELNAGLNVDVSLQGHRGPGYALGYNAAKQVIEGSLPNGSYLVEAMAFGTQPLSGETSLTVSGAAAEGQPLVLTPESSIPIQVKEEFTSNDGWQGSGSWGDGKRTFALHGPRLYLQVQPVPAEDFVQQRGAMMRPPTGPDDQSLVLEHLAPGRYWLRVSSGRGYVAEAKMGNVDLLREPLLVGQGSSSPIEITLRDDFADLLLTLSGPAGQDDSTSNTGPRQQTVWVYCVPVPDSAGQFQSFALSSEGETTSRIAPGTYRFLTFKRQQPNLPYRNPEAMKAYETKGQVVHLPPGQKTNVQLVVSPSD